MFVDAGAAAGAAALASGPHSAFRKSFHFIPLTVPAAWAALYLVLHSCIVRACTGRAIVAAATKAATQMVADRISMVASLFAVFSSREDHSISWTTVRTKRRPATVWQRTSVPHDASSATVRFETTGLFDAASNHPIIHPTFPTPQAPPLPSRNAARATIAKRLISLKPGARNPPDFLRHNKKPRRSGAKSAMWAAEKGGGNAAHTETLPQKRLPAQAGNVIQLRCKPTSSDRAAPRKREILVQPSGSQGCAPVSSRRGGGSSAPPHGR